MTVVNKHISSKKAFTLIELVVVMAIIATLASLIVGSIVSTRRMALDTMRKKDLDTIQMALIQYHSKNNNYISSGSGCGWAGNGSGYFNYSYPAPSKSIAQCIVDAGIWSKEVIDPTGGLTSTPTSGFAYMKYSCGAANSRTYVYAKLAGVAQSTTATDGTCCVDCDSLYGMNYYISLE